jgi:NAD(P)-dependent dehydrogenase (short-subunit alcohol dehydrogenase family)
MASRAELVETVAAAEALGPRVVADVVDVRARYSAAKHGIVGTIRSLANELGPTASG